MYLKSIPTNSSPYSIKAVLVAIVIALFGSILLAYLNPYLTIGYLNYIFIMALYEVEFLNTFAPIINL